MNATSIGIGMATPSPSIVTSSLSSIGASSVSVTGAEPEIAEENVSEVGLVRTVYMDDDKTIGTV